MVNGSEIYNEDVYVYIRIFVYVYLYTVYITRV